MNSSAWVPIRHALSSPLLKSIPCSAPHFLWYPANTKHRRHVSPESTRHSSSSSLPTIGAGTFPRSSMSQSIVRKNGCSFTSCASLTPPSLDVGSFRSNYSRFRSAAPLYTADRSHRTTPSTEHPQESFESWRTNDCDRSCRRDTTDHSRLLRTTQWTSISKSSTPKPHQSTAYPWVFSRSISGAMYSGVPHRSLEPRSGYMMPSLLSPKSPSLICPSSPIMTFSFFKSLRWGEGEESPTDA